MTRVLVTGSRHWKAECIVRAALTAAGRAYGFPGLVVVHGACPTGADPMAEQWAIDHADLGVTVERHPADWKRLGVTAGPVRNEEMVQSDVDLCLAFLDPGSRGTKDCLKRAKRDGIPHREFRSSPVVGSGAAG